MHLTVYKQKTRQQRVIYMAGRGRDQDEAANSDFGLQTWWSSVSPQYKVKRDRFVFGNPVCVICGGMASGTVTAMILDQSYSQAPVPGRARTSGDGLTWYVWLAFDGPTNTDGI